MTTLLQTLLHNAHRTARNWRHDAKKETRAANIRYVTPFQTPTPIAPIRWIFRGTSRNRGKRNDAHCYNLCYSVLPALLIVPLFLLTTPAHAASCTTQPILTLGDSITHSVVLPSSWPGDLAAATGASVENRAVTGWTTNLVLQQIGGAAPFPVDVRGKTVLVMTGVNDMMMQLITPELVASNLLMIAQDITARGGTPILLTLTGVHFQADDPPQYAALQSHIDALNAILRSWAARGYIHLIETGLPNESRYYDPRETVGARWLHPNALGNSVIAANVAAALCS